MCLNRDYRGAKWYPTKPAALRYFGTMQSSKEEEASVLLAKKESQKKTLEATGGSPKQSTTKTVFN